jgi:hypothetical protein
MAVCQQRPSSGGCKDERVTNRSASEGQAIPDSPKASSQFISAIRKCAASPDRLAIGLLVAIVSIISIIRLWVQPGLGDWDIVSFYLPWYSFMGEQLRSGTIPGWNPHIFSGMPFAGDPQSGWWYFPAMLIFTVFPAVTGFKIFIWLHLMLSALAGYALARLLGLHATGSFTAGLIFACLQVGAALTFLIQMQMSPWIAIALIGYELGRRANDWRRMQAAFSLSAFAFSQIVGCYLGQGAYYTALFFAAYIGWRFLVIPESERLRNWRTRLFAALLAGGWTFGIGALIAAAGVWPRYDAVKRAYVGSDAYRGVNDWAPDRGWESWEVSMRVFQLSLNKFDNYLGGGIITLALIGVVALPRYRRFGIFVAAALVAIHLPLRPTRWHELFYELPRFRETHLHDPGRVLVLLPLAFALLGGLAVDQIKSITRGWRLITAAAIVAIAWQRLLRADRVRDQWMMGDITKLSAAIVAAAVVAYAIARLARTNSMWIARLQVVLIGVLLAGIVIDPVGFTLTKSVKGASDSSLASAVTTGAATSDPGGAGAYIEQQLQQSAVPFRYVGYSAPPEGYAPLHEIFDQAWVEALLANNRAMRLGLYDAQGYNPAQIVRYQTLFTAINGFEREYHEALVQPAGLGSPLLDLLNVRYIIVPLDIAGDSGGQRVVVPYPPSYVEVWRNDTVAVLENRNVLPHAWIVHQGVELGATDALQQLNSGNIDPRTTASFETTPPAMSAPSSGASESVTVTEYEADHVTLTATAESDGVLVLSDVYDPDWVVRVDGKRSELYVVDGVLRGVALPAGEHTITFSYEPASLRYGLIVSSLTIAGLALFLGYVYRGAKRS